MILLRVLKDDSIDLAGRLASGISPPAGYAAGLARYSPSTSAMSGT